MKQKYGFLGRIKKEFENHVVNKLFSNPSANIPHNTFFMPFLRAFCNMLTFFSSFTLLSHQQPLHLPHNYLSKYLSRKMPTFGIHLDNYVSKKGRSNLFLRYTQNGRPQYVSLKKNIEPKFFLQGKQGKQGEFIKKTAPNAAALNYFLAEALNEAKGVVLEMERKKILVNFENFKKRYRNNHTTKFHAFATKQLKHKFYGKKNNGTSKTYQIVYDSFKSYVGDLSFMEITKEVIEKYRKIIIDTSSENTANYYLRRIKAVVKKADKEGIETNLRVFELFQFKQLAPKIIRDSLTLEELATIYQHYLLLNFILKHISVINAIKRLSEEESDRKETIQKVAELHSQSIVFFPEFNYLPYQEILEKHSIFSCQTTAAKEFASICIYFTSISGKIDIRVEQLKTFLFMTYGGGLRFSDAIDLTYQHLKTFDNRIFIDKKSVKSKKHHFFPLPNFCLQFIDRELLETKQQVFIPYTLNKFNQYLKKIVQELGINKLITSHCARHTFINLSIEMNIPENILLEFTQNPTSLRKHYARIKPQTLIQQLDSTWDNMKKKPEYGFHTKARYDKLRTKMMEIRKKRGWYQKDVADKIGKNGIAPSQISRYESGEQIPDSMYLIEFLRIFNISMDDLLKGNF